MSSETHFATSHSSFWNALLPMADSYIRTQNEVSNSFARGVPSFVPADQRAVVNEAAFRAFEEAIRTSKHPNLFSASALNRFLAEAVEFVRQFHQSSSQSLDAISNQAGFEAGMIAGRLYQFFSDEMPEAADIVGVQLRPSFPGCGWMDQAEGDVLLGLKLYEVKSGDRQFRVTDIRQILCYCALDFSSRRHEITDVVLVNPRAGTVIRENLDSLCYKVSGTDSSSLLGEIVDYVSEPLSRYQAS